jgi:hypothetical protein
MPLSPPVNRTLRHRRAISADAYVREDGLWDIEARITDHKSFDLTLAIGDVRKEGLPLHELWLRVTIDRKMNVVDAEACSDWVPYPGHCNTIGPAYRMLIGLNLMKGFRKAVRERLGGVEGCSHITELAGVLPTAAIQAFAGDVMDVSQVDESNPRPPFQLHGCHALHFEGEAVRKFYPRWYGYQPKPKARAEAAPPQAAQSADNVAGAPSANSPGVRQTGTSG